jgi:hypothetical protein
LHNRYKWLKEKFNNKKQEDILTTHGHAAAMQL